MPSSPILAFYRGDPPDGAVRTIVEVWAFDHYDIERHHDFIQWLFPLPQPSRFNPDAPILTPETAAEFHVSDDLRGRVSGSLDMMLGFYGFERVDGAIRPAADFEARAAAGAWPGDPNPLRPSRMVPRLAHMGLRRGADGNGGRAGKSG